MGWKLTKNLNDQMVVYPPSTKKNNGYKQVVDVDVATMEQITEEIINAYKEKIENPRTRSKDPPQLVSFNYNLMRHFYCGHKKELTGLRIYLVARQIIDLKGENCGRAEVKALCKILKISIKYLRAQCRRCPDLFSGYSQRFVYYRSLRKIIKSHRLDSKKSIIRQEKLNDRLLRFFSANKLFKSYITMAAMEKDVGKFGYTKGRISFGKVAEELFISPRTAFSNIKKSRIKKERNIRSYPKYHFLDRKAFYYWIADNKDLVVDPEIKEHIGDHLYSYFAKQTKKGDYVLARRLPNFYKITAVSQKKGRRKKSKK